tara:strand:- start:938 stop:1342 length:405 start_codon:yes stop_codon:yes gene_type:complete
MSEGQRKYDLLVGFTKGPLLSQVREAASHAGVTIEAWIMAAVNYRVLRDQSANAAISDYLIRIGHPSIWDDGTPAEPCPQCSAQEFSAGGGRDVTCTLCGATLIKCPPEFHEFIAGHRGDVSRGPDADEKEPWQ